MKSNPSRPGAPARPGASRPQTSRPPATAAQRAANARRTQDFIRGVVTEMKRVTWPSREEWVAATLLTVALVVAVGVYTFGADMLFGWIFGLLTGQAR